ncbi:toprim domain-containing protein [Novosphingobium sp.]|uniref:DUF7146 domain-containing protein n=1 Tax=Novosphingobium sp. TaxID=1874826 RepID=UPI00286E735B|nr:toprim domain-containing protein [Novosphingobium sp.]
MSAVSIERICADLNARAGELAPRLLPNGRYEDGRRSWWSRGIPDPPIGGDGKASLKVDLIGDRQGHWYDFGNCHASEKKGDMLDLVRIKMCHGDQQQAISEAKAILGIHDTFVPGPRRKPSPEELAQAAADARARHEAQQLRDSEDRERRARGARALYLHQLAQPIAGTPVEAYLRGRDLLPGSAWPNALRFHPEVWHRQERCKLPAMLAPMFALVGGKLRHMATHRTYLAQVGGRWGKLPGNDAKKVLGPSRGAFVPINRGLLAKGAAGQSLRAMAEGAPVYVTEGIEDAIVVRMMRPNDWILAAYSVTNMGMMVLPEAARDLVVVCDRDQNLTAQDQLEATIAKQQARGIHVSTVMPPEGVKDMNDWLKSWLAAQRKSA